MASSLGGVEGACAAARAGITRARELAGPPILDEDTVELAPVIGHAHPTDTEGFRGTARLVRLGAAALHNLLRYSGLPGSSLTQAACFLSIQSTFLHKAATAGESLEEHDAPAPEAVLALLTRTTGMHFSERHRVVRSDDHHGPLQAVQEAVALLQSLQVDRCIIGGIGCFLDPEVLERLHTLRLLKTAHHPVGFMPGEAAAFFLMERYDTARRRKGRIEAAIGPVAAAREGVHRFAGSSMGVGLAEAADRVLLAAGPRQPGLLIHNLNGENWRAMEWSSALMRLSARHSVQHLPAWFPAGSFGETGAATGPIAVCMATRGFARGYARARHVMIGMSSYDGHKACLMLEDVRVTQ